MQDPLQPPALSENKCVSTKYELSTAAARKSASDFRKNIYVLYA